MSATVTTDDLLDAREVAVLVGLSGRTSIAAYCKRYCTFPAPVVDKGLIKLWHRPEVEAWASTADPVVEHLDGFGHRHVFTVVDTPSLHSVLVPTPIARTDPKLRWIAETDPPAIAHPAAQEDVYPVESRLWQEHMGPPSKR